MNVYQVETHGWIFPSLERLDALFAEGYKVTYQISWVPLMLHASEIGYSCGEVFVH